MESRPVKWVWRVWSFRRWEPWKLVFFLWMKRQISVRLIKIQPQKKWFREKKENVRFFAFNTVHHFFCLSNFEKSGLSWLTENLVCTCRWVAQPTNNCLSTSPYSSSIAIELKQFKSIQGIQRWVEVPVERETHSRPQLPSHAWFNHSYHSLLCAAVRIALIMKFFWSSVEIWSSTVRSGLNSRYSERPYWKESKSFISFKNPSPLPLFYTHIACN